jgi:hypothetical protein
MQVGTWFMIPALQTKYGRWTRSPVARMIQSVAGLLRFRQCRCPSMITCSNTDVPLPSVGPTASREDVRQQLTQRDWGHA